MLVVYRVGLKGKEEGGIWREAQGLRELCALPGDPHLVLSTHMAAPNQL